MIARSPNNGCSAAGQSTREQGAEVNRTRPWTPKMWAGMDLPTWFRTLVRNRFAVAWGRLPQAMVVTALAVLNSLLGAIQQLLLGRLLARIRINDHPIFVIGHWRSGTTFMHELLSVDGRHTFPTTYECFCPHHFLITTRVVARWMSFVLPTRRIQDNMEFGWNRPQEDEFALCNLGAGSPLTSIAFPNQPPDGERYYDLDEVSPSGVENWKRALRRFLAWITFRSQKRIVLKSPQHTFRIRTLIEMFPDARFVYLVRDPYAVFPSTLKMWQALHVSQSLQTPSFERLEERVFETFQRMHETVEETRWLVPPGRFCEVRYEDLVDDPLAALRGIYQQLDLGEFETVAPAVRDHLARIAGYRTNRHELTAWQREQIARRWRSFLEQYGYDRQLPAPRRLAA